MSLANLTTSGWVLFALWVFYVADFAVGLSDKSTKHQHAPVLAILTTWLFWLVTP